MVVGRLLALLAEGRWDGRVGEGVDGDVVDGKIRDGQTIEEETGHAVGALAVHVGVVKQAVLPGVRGLSEGGETTVAVVEIWMESGCFSVKRGQAGVDAAGQGGVGGLSRERLDTNLQRHTLGHVRDGENVLRGGLRKLPDQLLVSSTDPD